MSITGKIVSLKDKNGNNVFPISSSEAIYMNDGKTLEQNTNKINSDLTAISTEVTNLSKDTVKSISIINDLTTGGISNVLSAEQGKALKLLLDSMSAGGGSLDLDALIARIERLERNMPSYRMNNIFASFNEANINYGIYRINGQNNYGGRYRTGTYEILFPVEPNCVYHIMKYDIPNTTLYINQFSATNTSDTANYTGCVSITGDYVNQYGYGGFPSGFDYAISGSQASFRTEDNTNYIEISVNSEEEQDYITGKYFNSAELILSSIKIVKVTA